MKLYFMQGETKKLIGEPHNEQELGNLVLNDGKKRFIAFKGKLNFTFAAGTEYSVNSDSGGKYLLED